MLRPPTLPPLPVPTHRRGCQRSPVRTDRCAQWSTALPTPHWVMGRPGPHLILCMVGLLPRPTRPTPAPATLVLGRRQCRVPGRTSAPTSTTPGTWPPCTELPGRDCGPLLLRPGRPRSPCSNGAGWDWGVHPHLLVRPWSQTPCSTGTGPVGRRRVGHGVATGTAETLPCPVLVPAPVWQSTVPPCRSDSAGQHGLHLDPSTPTEDWMPSPVPPHSRAWPPMLTGLWCASM